MTVESEENRKVTQQEASRKGGEKVAEERGSEFYREIDWKGGESREKSSKEKAPRIAGESVNRFLYLFLVNVNIPEY